MKKSFVGLAGNKALLAMTGVLAAIGLRRQKAENQFDAPKDNPIRRSNKSSGGSRKPLRGNREKAWKRVFGGLAVPAYQD